MLIENLEEIGAELKARIMRLYGRSLHIRALDSGSCNGCEIELTQLLSPFHDLQRFGLDFVASPRHADALLITGPVSRNLEGALRDTLRATPDPKLVIALGACACSGGIFGEGYACHGGVDRIAPVDVYIPGCPPRPQAIIHGLLLAIDRIECRLT